MDLLLGVVTGIVFGVLLQKGQVLRFEKQVGFLTLRDMTIIKFMFSAIVVGMIGIFMLADMGMITFDIKAAVMGAQVIGGLLFGIGWALAGYCPGTAVGAFAEGRVHALWVLIGMLCGAALYAELYPAMKNSVLQWGVLGEVTIPQVLHLNHWVVIGVFAIGILGLFRWFALKNK